MKPIWEKCLGGKVNVLMDFACPDSFEWRSRLLSRSKVKKDTKLQDYGRKNKKQIIHTADSKDIINTGKELANNSDISTELLKAFLDLCCGVLTLNPAHLTKQRESFPRCHVTSYWQWWVGHE